MKLAAAEKRLNNPDVKLVGPNEVLQYANEIARLLQKSEPYYSEFMGIEDIVARACMGKFQIWLVRENGAPFVCVVTEVMQYPRKKVLNILQVSGDTMHGLWPHVDIGERWAAAMGCTHVEFQCREAIARIMKRQGYERKAVVMQKTLHGIVKEN